MMDSIEKLCDLSAQIHEIVEESYPDGIRCVLRSSATRTGAALVSLVAKTEFLKNAILDIAETDNVYSIKILFRSLLEHFLKSQYLFTRHISEKTDAAGEEYYLFCDLIEDVNMLSAHNKVAKIVSPDTRELKAFETIREREPNLAQLSNDDIRQKANQFTYKRMVEFLLAQYYKDSTLSTSNFLLSILPKYAELSSFVHGGPASDKYVGLTQNEERNRETLELAQLALLMATHVKLTIFVLFHSIDKRFAKPCSEIERFLKAITTKGATFQVTH